MTDRSTLERIGHAIATSPGVASLIEATMTCVTTLGNWIDLSEYMGKFNHHEFFIKRLTSRDVPGPPTPTPFERLVVRLFGGDKDD